MVSQSPLSMRSLHTGLPATLSSGSTTSSSSSPRQPQQPAEPPGGHNGHYPGPELPATNGHHQEPAPAPAPPLPTTGLSSLPSYSPVYNNNNNNVNNVNNSPAARHYRYRSRPPWL